MGGPEKPIASVIVREKIHRPEENSIHVKMDSNLTVHSCHYRRRETEQEGVSLKIDWGHNEILFHPFSATTITKQAKIDSF